MNQLADIPAPSEVLSALQVALLVVDHQGFVRDANATSEILLNTSAGHIIGRALDSIFELPASYDPSNASLFTAFDLEFKLARGGRFHADFQSNGFPERPDWRLITLYPSAGAQRVGLSLSRRGGARAAINIAAALAHEIKNPLSGIRGAAQLLEKNAVGADRVMTQLIQTEVDRIAALIDQMEGFTDTRLVSYSAHNIHEIIDHARRVAEAGFGANLKIVAAYDPSLPLVSVNRDQMIQIFLNLFKNAAESAAVENVRHVQIMTRFRHGVSVAVSEGGKKMSLPIEVSVCDDGPGAPPELSDTLFDPFVSSKRTGRGLGLALVDKMLRDMGGMIQYSREGYPEMTIFRLLLPVAEREN